MPRYCIAPNCKSHSSNAVAHRFPKNEQLAKIWQTHLQAEHISINELQKRYVVCGKHFQRSDYRNTHSKFLNKTAIPIKLQSVHIAGTHSDDDNDKAIKMPNPQEHPLIELDSKQHDTITENKTDAKICETVKYLEEVDKEIVFDRPNQCGDNLKCVKANDKDDANDTDDSNDTNAINSTEMEEEHFIVYVEQDPNECNNNITATAIESLPNNNENQPAIVNENFPNLGNPIIITVADELVTSSAGTPPVSSSTKETLYNNGENEINSLMNTHGKGEITELLQLSQLDLIKRLLNANNRILELETTINNFDLERTKLLTNIKNIKEILNS